MGQIKNIKLHIVTDIKREKNNKMDALLGQRPISLKALFDFSKIDASTKKHLRNVYAALAITTLAAAAGAAIHLFTDILKGGILASLAGIGFILALGFTSNEPKNQIKRLGYLAGFGACTGLSLGPLLDHVIAVNPQIVSTAFFASALIFVCFSLTALWAEDRSYLYLGGSLMSALSIMSFLALGNIFFRSLCCSNCICMVAFWFSVDSFSMTHN